MSVLTKSTQHEQQQQREQHVSQRHIPANSVAMCNGSTSRVGWEVAALTRAALLLMGIAAESLLARRSVAEHCSQPEKHPVPRQQHQQSATK